MADTLFTSVRFRTVFPHEMPLRGLQFPARDKICERRGTKEADDWPGPHDIALMCLMMFSRSVPGFWLSEPLSRLSHGRRYFLLTGSGLTTMQLIVWRIMFCDL